MGKNLVQNFIEPDYRKSVEEVLQNALAGKGTANFEFVLKSKSVRTFTVLLNQPRA